MCGGRAFHERDEATGNARSPMEERLVAGTVSVVVSADRRHRRGSAVEAAECQHAESKMFSLNFL